MKNIFSNAQKGVQKTNFRLLNSTLKLITDELVMYNG